MMDFSLCIKELSMCMAYISGAKSLFKLSITYMLLSPMYKSGKRGTRGAPLYLVKKMKTKTEMEKEKV